MELEINIRHVEATPEINAYWEVTVSTPSAFSLREVTRCFAYGPAHYHDEAREALDAAEDYIKGVSDALDLLRRGGTNRTGLNRLEAARLAGKLDDDQA